MDESNVLESGFLERINTLLANAEIPGLFEAEEWSQVLAQCKEVAAREGSLLDAPEDVNKWFTKQIAKHLHVVFTMHPPEGGLAKSAVLSPALFNRCVLNWFGKYLELYLNGA